MIQVVLHLGSNLGSRIKNISLAKYFIEKRIGKIFRSSNLYETEAWGVKDQAKFINAAVIIDTELSPIEVLEQIHSIENKLGRERLEKWAERIIDIDILFYGDQIIKKANLKIPHSEITNRNFVLIPLNEIIPDYFHPENLKTINKLLAECQDSGEVRLYDS